MAKEKYATFLNKYRANKKILIFSSMNNSIESEETNMRILEIIRLYNSIKFGIDMTDQMDINYVIKFKSRRWPL